MPAPPDVLAAILTDFRTLIAGLSLGPPVVVRKGAKKEPGVDAATQITISKAVEAERKIKIAFGHLATVWPIEVTLIAPNNDDFVTNMGTYSSYRQQIAALFGPPYASPLLPTAPGVYNLAIRPKDYLNRGDMANNVDRWTLVVDVYTAI
ncbi:hypothetical protein [Frigoriglobus tundricola]|uniref:Uncharacterized protein n=1 Tax=Frigoriglobus tundricola TaxID=2774151 RepID=A0A6M5YZ05_9BACT|nr:hypothetical protein [Frigoriglobus tundricola]QJW98686.1 hypothetical protein FTUN_6281 [Frigoriglobus tundricola]